MTREEATEVLKLYLFDEDEKIAEDVKKFDEALRMAIEALSEPINCVKCAHYTETEDEDGVKGRCKREKHQLSGEIPTESTNTPTDLISREDAIDAVQGWMGNQEHDYYLKRVEEDIESLPSADRPHGEWIPVTERLPEKSDIAPAHYLVTIREDSWFYDEVYEAFYTKDGWIIGESHTLNDDDVIAWMQLPEPYKGGEKK